MKTLCKNRLMAWKSSSLVESSQRIKLLVLRVFGCSCFSFNLIITMSCSVYVMLLYSKLISPLTYTYIHIHTHTYTYIHIHTYTHTYTHTIHTYGVSNKF